MTIDYDDFMKELRERKARRWAKILASEAPGRAPGRRQRDPKKEELLLMLDRARLKQRKL